jgi:hypothetical protein
MFVSGPARKRRRSLRSKINDLVSGGSYTDEPSEHNRMLYERERTPMLRWRLVGAANLFLGVVGFPVQILVMGIPSYFKDLPGFVEAEWDRVKTGKLYS